VPFSRQSLPTVLDEAEPRHEVSDGLDQCLPTMCGKLFRDRSLGRTARACARCLDALYGVRGCGEKPLNREALAQASGQ
jgi:hypothetical protein